MDSRFPDKKSFQIECVWRRRPTAANQQEKRLSCPILLTSKRLSIEFARILPVGFPDFLIVQNFDIQILIKHNYNSLWLLFKQDLFINFLDYKDFPCSNATTLQGVLGLCERPLRNNGWIFISYSCTLFSNIWSNFISTFQLKYPL